MVAPTFAPVKEKIAKRRPSFEEKENIELKKISENNFLTFEEDNDLLNLDELAEANFINIYE